MTPQRLAEIEARAKAATEGPWHCWNGWPVEPQACERIGPKIAGGVKGNPDIFGQKEDFEFIAHARQDIPDLLADRQKLIERIRELEAHVEELDAAIVGGLLKRG